MKDKKIPTVIGLAIIVIGIAVSVVLVNYTSIQKTEASTNILPKNVRVTNISSSSFSVSWTTDEKTLGFVSYGNNENNLSKSAHADYEELSYIHWVTVENLKESSEYSFNINSNGTEFDNNGASWTAKTGPQATKEPLSRIVTGSVVNQNGVPVANALVIMTVGGSSPLSTITEEDGEWFLIISKARNPSLDNYVAIDENSTLLEMVVQAANFEATSAQVYPSSANPIPTITLGGVNNFKNSPKNGDKSVPEASINLYGSFENGGVRLTYPDSKTMVLTTHLEIKGTAPPQRIINITIEPISLSGKAISGQDGTWKWLPKGRFPTGNYKVLLSWKGDNNQEESSSHNFSIIASQ